MTQREWSLWVVLLLSMVSQGLMLWRYQALVRDRRKGRPLCELHGGDVLTPEREANLLMKRLLELARNNDAKQRRQAAQRLN